MDQIILHNINSPSEWPVAVQPISCLLYQPLADPPGSGTSSTSFNDALQGTDERPNPRVTIQDVNYTVSAAVERIRAMDALNQQTDGPLHPTWIFWLPLLSSLCRMCSEHASVSSQATFILPRSDKTRFDSAGGVRDGHSYLLASCVVDELVPKDGVGDRADHLDECKVVEENGNPTQESAKHKIRLHKGSDTTTSNSSEPPSTSPSTKSVSTRNPILVPFCAHVIPGRGLRTDAVLPVISVAEEDEIQSLLTSVLYQRYVWGIEAPAVGIAISATGTVARIILGWIDPLPPSTGALPAVHLASASVSPARDPSLAIYDLTDLPSALALSRFILNLSAQFDRIIKGARSPHFHPLPWRADHIYIDELLPNEADDLDMCQLLNRAHVSSCSISAYIPFTNDLPLGAMSRPSKSTKSDKLRSISELAVSLDGTHISLPPPSTSEVQSRSSSTKPPSKKKPYSASTFAALQPSSKHCFSDQATPDSWLMERNVLQIPYHRFVPTGHPELHADMISLINAKLDLYDEISSFPNIDINSLMKCQVPSQLEPWREILRDSYAAAELSDSKTLDLATHSLLKTRLYDILDASSTSRHLVVAAKGRAVFESEYRAPWDRLLYKFTITEDIYVSPNVLLERSINLPANRSLKKIEANESLSAHYQTMATSRKYLWTTTLYDTVRARLSEDIILGQVNKTSAVGTALNDLTDDTLSTHVRKHCLDEPVSAKVDATLVATVPLPCLKVSSTPASKLPEFVGRAALIRHSSPPKTSPPDELPHTPHNIHPDMPEASKNGERLLRLAIFFAEYKKAGKKLEEVSNQARIDCTSAVTFLDELGLSGEPVFYIVTLGSIGWLHMGWKAGDQIFLMDKSVKSFDISNPVECLHFAVILLRLAKRGQDLVIKYASTPESIEELDGRFRNLGPDGKRCWIRPRPPKEVRVAAGPSESTAIKN
ncbi:hypothetical protein D9615_007362 [Tricholomella constricta]|uniref:Uncharacterized protein n=1 Tax=Tricholomella constricta TaxID=117010 RepID=A0A8H5GY82_9AGAR|nr:hypothetical protein D9615_007362 [Tricholomella constricta]